MNKNLVIRLNEVVEKYKSEKHEVELALIDDVAKEITSLTDELLVAKAKYSNAVTEIRSKAEKTINAYSKIQDKLIKIEKQINELGIVAPKNFDDAGKKGYNMFVIAKQLTQDVKEIK